MFHLLMPDRQNQDSIPMKIPLKISIGKCNN